MCTFVAGEIIAFGPGQELDNAVKAGKFEDTQRISLDPEITNVPVDERFNGQVIYLIRGIPHGYEVAAVSRLSGLLAPAIASGKALVELNHRLPLAAVSAASVRLSGQARRWADAISRTFSGSGNNAQGVVAVIDSGINPSALLTSRSIEGYDYSDADDVSPRRVSHDHDERKHGTIVAKVLDETLPPGIKLVSAKIGDETTDVTTLRLCRVLADVVVRTQPRVVNISLAPADHTVTCGGCGARLSVANFQSEILARVIHMSCPSIVVLAAGNVGQPTNFGRFGANDSPVVLAMALGSDGERTRYTNAPSGGLASIQGAAAFGGDDPEREGGAGVTESRNDVGTSFAAPFVTAVACAIDLHYVPLPDGAVDRVREIRSRLQWELLRGGVADFLRS